MRYKASTLRIIEKLKELYPEGLCSLQYEKDYELLFAVRLSAQCTDARVNLVTPALFARFPTLEAFAAGGPQRRWANTSTPAGSTMARSKDLVACAQQLLERFGGKVPGQHGGSHLPPRRGPEDRQPDPGGRVRPALLCLRHPLHPHHRAAGHHRRVQGPGEGGAAAAQGHPSGRNPAPFCHRMVLFGRDVCTARSPKCEDCPLKADCAQGKKLK